MTNHSDSRVTALVEGLLEFIAPLLLAADAGCGRAASNRGLSAAQAVVAAWFADLAYGDRAEALRPARLEAALRALFVRALSLGQVGFRADPAHCEPQLRLGAEDHASVELVRDLAVALDAASGAGVAARFDAFREATLARLFAMARAAAERNRA